jgi:hypothetical protein
MNSEISNYDGKVNVKNINEINELKGVDFENLSRQEAYKLAKDIFKKYNNNNCFINDFNKIYVSNGDIKESINKIFSQPIQKEFLSQHLQIFSDLGDIIEIATLVSQVAESKKDKQSSHIDNQLWNYYLNGLKINENSYLFEFDVVSRQDGENHYRVQRLQKINEKTNTSAESIASSNTYSTSEVFVSDNTIASNKEDVK